MLYYLSSTTLGDAGLAAWIPGSRSRGIGRVAVVGIWIRDLEDFSLAKSNPNMNICRHMDPLCSTTSLVQHLGMRGCLRGCREADPELLVGIHWQNWTKLVVFQ